MVLDVELKRTPLCSTGWVFTSVVAGVHTIVVLVSLGAGMPEVKDVPAAWIMRNDILVMNDPPVLRPDCLDERREFLSANSWLTKVVHLSLNTIFNQVKTSQKRHRGTKTMPCRLYLS